MKGPALLWYTVIRLVFFVAPLVGLLLLRVNFIIAVIAAAIVGVCLSFLFLGKPRNAVAEDIYARTHRSTPVTGEDDDFEDAFQKESEERRAHEQTAKTEQPSEHDAERDAEESTVGQRDQSGEL